MSDQSKWANYEGVALTFSEEGFEDALLHAETFDVLRRPDVLFTMVSMAGAWRVMDTDAVLQSAADPAAPSAFEYFRSNAVVVEPDFAAGQMTTSGRSRSVVFVPLRIQVPGIEPTPTYDQTYICDEDEAHIVLREAGSAGDECGEPCANGASCPGVLSEW